MTCRLELIEDKDIYVKYYFKWLKKIPMANGSTHADLLANCMNGALQGILLVKDDTPVGLLVFEETSKEELYIPALYMVGQTENFRPLLYDAFRKLGYKRLKGISTPPDSYHFKWAKSKRLYTCFEVLL